MAGSECLSHPFSMSLSLSHLYPSLLPLPSCESGFFSTWALLCSDPQQQPELYVVTAQWSKWAIFAKILTGVLEQSNNTGHALITVLMAETELFKSTFLDPSRPREGREWPSKEENSGHQTDKSHRCLCSPPLAPCSLFLIRHGPPCPMAPPPHNSPAWIRNDPFFSSASCFMFPPNTPCDPKSAASSKSVETLDLMYPKSFVLPMRKVRRIQMKWLPPVSLSYFMQIHGFSHAYLGFSSPHTRLHALMQFGTPCILRN